jgi:cell shape-determining protein MreC
MQEFCNHTNKTIQKKTCTRQTNNKLKKELKEKIIKDKAKEVEESHRRQNKKIDIRAATPFLGVSSKICKKKHIHN